MKERRRAEEVQGAKAAGRWPSGGEATEPGPPGEEQNPLKSSAWRTVKSTPPKG